MFGARIKQERLKRDWTQRQLAIAADITEKTLRRTEADDGSPSSGTAARLIRALELDAGEMFALIGAGS